VFSVILVAALIGISWILSDREGAANLPVAGTTSDKGASSGTAADQRTAPPGPKTKPLAPSAAAGTGAAPDDGPAPAKPAPNATHNKPAADSPLAAEIGSLRVTVGSACRTPQRSAAEQPATAARLLITVEVKNLSGTKKVEFPGWAPRGLARGVSLTDNFNNAYQAKPLGRAPVPGEGPPMSIYPDAVAREVLAFEPPIAKIEFLQLELPATILGGQGVLRFKIPAEKITEEAAAGAKPADAPAREKSPKKSDRRRPGSEFGIPE
jgi:hypothetical protein